MAKLTKEQRETFLAGDHVGVLSVAREDGRAPLTAPIWYSYEPGGNLTFFTSSEGTVSQKVDLIRKAGVLSFCVQHEQPPYKYVSIEGSVVGEDQPPSEEQMLAIASRYLPEEVAPGFVAAELGREDSQVVVFTIRPERWFTADFSE
jgi:nitroimidazol reductase NimA-like FMN-containing flavoprotein (pyridoxamine 5'-phosphate oxidase superfamily)